MIARLTEVSQNLTGTAALAWMQDHTEVPVVAATLYLFLVLYVPRNIMAHRNPLNLRFLNILWNLLLTVFSICGAYYCTPRLFEWCTASSIPGLLPRNPGEPVPVVSGSFYTSVCYWNQGMFLDGTVGLWLLLICVVKFLTLVDTVFLVLQKQPVSFLHWYQHVTVMLFCWHAYVGRISSGLWFATMNYWVHSIMYFYYFVCACGFRKVIRPIAPFITALQLLQMVAGMLIMLYVYVERWGRLRGCETKDSCIRLGFAMYGSYFVLLTRVFVASYMRRKPRKREPVVKLEDLIEAESPQMLKKHV